MSVYNYATDGIDYRVSYTNSKKKMSLKSKAATSTAKHGINSSIHSSSSSSSSGRGVSDSEALAKALLASMGVDIASNIDTSGGSNNGVVSGNGKVTPEEWCISYLTDPLKFVL